MLVGSSALEPSFISLPIILLRSLSCSGLTKVIRGS